MVITRLILQMNLKKLIPSCDAVVSERHPMMTDEEKHEALADENAAPDRHSKLDVVADGSKML